MTTVTRLLWPARITNMICGLHKEGAAACNSLTHVAAASGVPCIQASKAKQLQGSDGPIWLIT
eukprot:4739997-Pyramimonas_sp.AAC.1